MIKNIQSYYKEKNRENKGQNDISFLCVSLSWKGALDANMRVHNALMIQPLQFYYLSLAPILVSLAFSNFFTEFSNKYLQTFLCVYAFYFILLFSL